MTNDQYSLCITTVNDSHEAEKIASQLLQQKLVACVNIIDKVKSLYWWQGKVETDQEYLLLMKTSRSCINRLQSSLLNIHPYQTPEFIVLDITNGSPDYLNWLSDSVKSPEN
ncbi:MAG: divalent-cation tolerance protein CutA [Gammaproteobacteria bacterium]|nr:divalent-cation tolerance protein CutA [Gammaproteobacteria bacterium]MDH5629276.1 divalent-cation tolerance protein CutA [Gammaproteobacteria bacterium]